MLVPTTQKRFNDGHLATPWCTSSGVRRNFIHKALSDLNPYARRISLVTAGLLMLGVTCKAKYLTGQRSDAGVTGLLLFIDTGIIIWVEQFLASGLVAIMASGDSVILDKPRWGKISVASPSLPVYIGFAGVTCYSGIN